MARRVADAVVETILNVQNPTALEGCKNVAVEKGPSRLMAEYDPVQISSFRCEMITGNRDELSIKDDERHSDDMSVHRMRLGWLLPRRSATGGSIQKKYDEMTRRHQLFTRIPNLLYDEPTPQPTVLLEIIHRTWRN